jgi:hypothetical protein
MTPVQIEIEERDGSAWPPNLEDYKDIGRSDATGQWLPPSSQMPLGGELTYKLAYKKWSSIDRYLSHFVVCKSGTFDVLFRSENWITDEDRLPEEYVETVTRREAAGQVISFLCSHLRP